MVTMGSARSRYRSAHTEVRLVPDENDDEQLRRVRREGSPSFKAWARGTFAVDLKIGAAHGLSPKLGRIVGGES